MSARDTKQFAVRLRCTVTKVVIVEATTAMKARAMAEAGDWEDATESELVDWEVLSVKEDA